MGRKSYRRIRNIVLKNSLTGTGAQINTGISNVNRDPKTFNVARIGYALITGSGSGRDNFETPTTGFQLIDDVIEKDSYATQSVVKYSELVLKSGYTLKWTNQQAYQYLKSRLDVMAEATNTPTETLFQGIIEDLVRYSNSFVVKARAKKGVGIPQGLNVTPILPSKEGIAGYFRLPPKTMSISREEDGTILAYKQEIEGGSGDPIEFNPEDMIHFTLNQGVGNAFGTPYLAPVIEDIRLLRKIEENVAIFIYRHIFPLLKYKVGESSAGKEATPDEIDEAQSALDNIPADGGIVLPERHELESLKIESVDMKDYLTYFENRVFSGLGITQVDMGRGDTANRNTADAMSTNKIDRVKSWQRIISTQINNLLIEELLIEGGFDPLVNPDFRISFEFDEIENEKRIALENHAIQKWNNNLLTFEEARLEMGQDPVADESRLAANMIVKQDTSAEGSANSSKDKAVDNKDKPENQNGKKSAPKESFKESIDKLKRLVEAEDSGLHIAANFIKDILEDVKNYTINQIVESKATNYAETLVQVNKVKFTTNIKSVINEAVREGSLKYKGETHYKGNLKSSKIMPIEAANDWFNKFNNDLKESVNEILNSSDENSMKFIKINMKTEMFYNRFCTFAEYIYGKSKEYGYVLTAIQEQRYEYIYVESDNGCSMCQERHMDRFSIKNLSEIEKHVLYTKLPPFHANCNCTLTGGET